MPTLCARLGAVCALCSCAALGAGAGAEPLTCQPPKAVTPGLHELTLDIGSTRRELTVHVPRSYQAGTALPAVIHLHASGITASESLQITGFDAAAEAGGMIVALPHAQVPFFRGGYTWSWSEDGLDDVAFVDRVIDHLAGSLCIDTDEVYVSGFSGGARLASELACRLSDRIAAVSVVGGLRSPDSADCTGADGGYPPIRAIHSVDDPVNPYRWSPATSPHYWTQGVEQAAADWARRMQCAALTESGTGGAPTRRRYQDCSNGGGLELWILRGSGHTWPGSQYRFPPQLGSTDLSLSATELSIEWFRDHAAERPDQTRTVQSTHIRSPGKNQ